MYGICNVFDHLICWLQIVYNVCISHIVRWCLVWGLLVVYVKFLGLFQCWCTKFDLISGCVSAFICSVYRVLKDLPVKIIHIIVQDQD